MAETITRVDYFYIETPNKPGEAARALNGIKEAGIDLLAFSGFPKGRRAQLDFIPADSAAFAKCAKKAGCTLSKKKSGFLIQGEDRIGAVAASSASWPMRTSMSPPRRQSAPVRIATAPSSG